jgi:hypothetical protein
MSRHFKSMQTSIGHRLVVTRRIRRARQVKTRLHRIRILPGRLLKRLRSAWSKNETVARSEAFGRQASSIFISWR